MMELGQKIVSAVVRYEQLIIRSWKKNLQHLEAEGLI